MTSDREAAMEAYLRALEPDIMELAKWMVIKMIIEQEGRDRDDK